MKALILLGSTIVNFGVTFGIISASFAAPQGRAEKILGYQPTKTGLIFQVASGGCTQIEDFTSEVRRDSETGIAELVLIRTRPDLCYPFLPMGERFRFSYDDLGLEGGEPFIIRNENGIVHGWIWGD